MTNLAQLKLHKLSISLNKGIYSLKCIWTFVVGLSSVPIVNSKNFALNSSSNEFGPSTASRCPHSSYCETRPDLFKLNLLYASTKSLEFMSLRQGIDWPEHGRPITFVTDAYVIGISVPFTFNTDRWTSTFRANSAHNSRCSLVTFNSMSESNPSEHNSLRNWGYPFKPAIIWLFSLGLHLVCTTVCDWKWLNMEKISAYRQVCMSCRWIPKFLLC